MKIAFVYDRVNKWGGAERVLLSLHEIWPEAPLYTSVFNSRTSAWAKVFPGIIPSFLQGFPLARLNHEVYFPLMPLVFESLNFDSYDVVVSVTSEAAKGIITKPETLHICYCLTPTRYLWSAYEQYFDNRLQRVFTKGFVDYLRGWDKVACKRPDYYIAISQTVRERIKKYYGRESEVIYPPVDVDKFVIPSFVPSFTGLRKGKQNSKYFLVVSRLVKYKKIDLAIEAFNQLGWNLKIVGVGREMKKLKKMAGENIEFLGQLTDEELLGYYQDCQAVIVPQEEDFGIVPLESQSCGKPVIAYRGGGVQETVIENKTGLFFDCQKAESLVTILKRFREFEKGKRFRSVDCRGQAEKFGKERFKEEFKIAVEEKWQNHLKTTYIF